MKESLDIVPIRSTRGLSIKIEKADIESFESDGYLVVKDVISKRRIQKIRDAFEVIGKKVKTPVMFSMIRNIPMPRFYWEIYLLLQS